MTLTLSCARFESLVKANPRWFLQPRVPAGDASGGQWTDGGGRLIRVGARISGSGGRRNRAAPRDPAQATRLAISHSQMQTAVRRIKELDPRWKPTPQAFETVKGEIAANHATLREGEARLRELQRVGIGPGPFALEWQAARGPGRHRSAEEIRENNRIGRKYGCHTCGTKDPGTANGRFILDHQDSSALIQNRRAQILLPHCLLCSLKQGG